jgi:hypothetical protein|nr:MAG TPA: hypothetical protein [Caudoviricetes sp.]
MKRELTLADVIGYLPYRLHCIKPSGFINIWAGIKGFYYPDLPDNMGKPILRPMSDLYVEITERGYNDGKAFIPIAELANIVEKQESAQWIFEQADKRMYSCYWKDWFLWEHEWKTFIRTDSLNSSTACIITCSYKLYDFLCRLHFDYRGLIDDGSAINVHDLPKNPYEA